MAYTVTNNPWTSQYSVGIGTEGPGTNLEVFGTDAEMMVHYTGNSRGGFRAMSTQRLAILSTASSDNLVFGYETDFKSTFTERMRIVNSTGNVGIGTTSPVGKLDVATGGNTNIVISNDSTDTGYNIISLNGTRTKGSYAGIAGGGTGDNKLYLNSGVEIVMQTGASYTERMRITSTGAMQISRVASDITFGDNVGGMYVKQNGNGAGTQEELRIFGRNISLVSHTGTRYMDVTSTGNVGINTSSPGTYKLNVNGTFYSAGSSLEYKKDIETFDANTNKILELRPVTYQYKDEYKHLGKELKSGTQIGLIAEEVAEVFPELAILKEDEDGVTRVRNVDYEKLSILLLSEVQKLRKEVNELKAQ